MKIIKYLIGLMVVASTVYLSGCSTTRAYSDYVEGVNFNQFKTFAWLPSADSTSTHQYENQIVAQNIRNQVTNEMTARGYTTNPENPDLLIITHYNFEEKEEIIRTPMYGSYNYYYPGFYSSPGYPYNYYYYNSVPNIIGYDIRPVEFTQGTIVVDIIKADTKELIWRGWSESRIDAPDEVRNDVQSSIDEIFDTYPLGEKRG